MEDHVELDNKASTSDDEQEGLLRVRKKNYGTSPQALSGTNSPHQIFTRWFIYNKTFYKSCKCCKPCSDPKNKIVQFVDGFGFCVNSIWPVGFGGILIYDVVQYIRLNENYGDSFAKLFIGISTNPSMLSTNYGNYAPNSFMFWCWPVLFSITPFFAGLFRMVFCTPSVRRLAFHNKENDDSLERLQNTRSTATRLKWLFADYRLWSIGQNKSTDISRQASIGLQVSYWLFNIALFASGIRIIQQIAMRIIYARHFFSAKNACEMQHKVYTFLQQLGEYACSICGDWPEVYTQNVFSSQGCLDGLMGVSQLYGALASGIKRLIPFGGITSIDFSQQKWPQWSPEEWQSLLKQIALATQQLSLLNLSIPANQQIIIGVEKANSLGRFLDEVSVETLDLHNTWNGSIFVSSIFSATRFAGLTNLDLSDCQIDDDVFVNNISASLPYSIAALKLSNNQITDQGCNQGLYNLRNSSLSVFDISYNQLQGQSFPSLKTSVPQNLMSIDYAGNDFSQADLTPFWQLTCDNSTIVHVSFQSTAISDFSLINAATYIPETSVTDINFADNAITDYGFSEFVPALVNSPVAEIDFSGNLAITDVGMEFAAPYFINTLLKSIKFGNIGISNLGVSALLQGVMNSSIESISLAENTIDDGSAQEISEWTCRLGNPIKKMDLSNNQITSLDGNILKGNLTSLILNGNKLSQQTVTNLLTALPNSPLKQLGLNGVGLANSTRALWSGLANSSIEELDIGNNFLLDEGTISLASELIKSSPEIKNLANAKIDLKTIRWFANDAQPNTKLKKINVENSGFTSSGGRALCRVIPGSRIPFKNIDLTPNSEVNPDQLILQSCRFTQINYQTNSRLHSKAVLMAKPSQSHNLSGYLAIGLSSMGVAMLVILVLMALFLLYRLYQVVRPKVSAFANQNCGFFAKSKSHRQVVVSDNSSQLSQTV